VHLHREAHTIHFVLGRDVPVELDEPVVDAIDAELGVARLPLLHGVDHVEDRQVHREHHAADLRDVRRNRVSAPIGVDRDEID
jgi:hypothetical protein